MAARAITLIKVGAALYLVVSTAIIAFGRNVPAIWQGMFGLIASLEGYYGAERGQSKRVLFFLIALIPCIAVSFALGILAITGNELLVTCNSAGQQVTVVQSNNVTGSSTQIDFGSCSTSFKLYGYVELLGGAALGVVIWIVVASSYSSLKQETDRFEDKQTEIETKTLKNQFHV